MTNMVRSEGEAALATVEASLTLALLGQVLWEEGNDHAWLPVSVGTTGPRLGWARVGIVHSPLSPPSQVFRGN